MTTNGTGSFTSADYVEATFSAVDGGPKAIRSTVTNTYTGAISGEGKQAYLGVFRDDGSGTWVGLEQITGRIDGRSGSFVIQQTGTFDEHGVQASWEVVAGSGTGGLAELRGTGTLRFTMGSQAADYTIDAVTA